MAPRIVPANCPSCGAALEVDAGAREATCEYCGKTALISKRAPPPTPHAPPTIVVPARRTGPIIAVVVGVLVLAMGVAAAVVMTLVTSTVESFESIASTPASTQPTADAATRLAAAASPSQAPRNLHEPHPECICRTDLDGDGSPETSVQIANRVHYFEGDELLTTYWVDISGQESWMLPVDARTAPAITADAHYRTMYLACRGPVMAIAADDRITGWNLVERKAMWTTPLGGDYVSHMEVPAHEEGQFTTQCTRLDSATPEVLELNTKHGPVHVRLRDGVVQLTPG